MCCIFTCCGWMIDLVQRAWTFTMSCIIMSAVMGVMVTSSMSGIALGYNYSLAEYIDLKETNVSVYLKRGVFDDEIADDMEWRRAGHLPVEGQLKDDGNLRTGAPADDDSRTQRSGRRLDDSVFEADNQNRYEGSLMQLTAKPVHQDTMKPHVTDDKEMAEIHQPVYGEPVQGLDKMKAIQSLIDSRRAMATGGTTVSPLATYEAAGPILPYLPSDNKPNLDVDVNPDGYRRLLPPGRGIPHKTLSPYNAARQAVPDPASLGSRINWLAPKLPLVFAGDSEFYIPSPTYPSPVTIAGVRPTIPPVESDNWRRNQGALLLTFSPRKQETLPATRTAIPEEMDKQPDFYNEKVLAEGNEFSKNDNMMKMPKMGNKSPEEEYEDEIKGLPVRKRRSIMENTLVTEGRNPTEKHIIHSVENESSKSIGILSFIKNIFKIAVQTISNEDQSNYELNITTDKNQGLVKEINDSQIGIKMSDEGTIKHQMDINEQRKSDIVREVKIIPERDLTGETTTKSLLDHLVTSIRTKDTSLVTETTRKEDVVTSTAKKIKIKTKRRSFESRIVSSKYVQNDLTNRLEKKQPFSNQEILNSISVGLNEAGLFRDPASSTLVKLLQSTLNA